MVTNFSRPFVILNDSEELFLERSEKSYTFDRYALDRSPLYLVDVDIARRRFFALAQNDKNF